MDEIHLLAPYDFERPALTDADSAKEAWKWLTGGDISRADRQWELNERTNV